MLCHVQQGQSRSQVTATTTKNKTNDMTPRVMAAATAHTYNHLVSLQFHDTQQKVGRLQERRNTGPCWVYGMQRSGLLQGNNEADPNNVCQLTHAMFVWVPHKNNSR